MPTFFEGLQKNLKTGSFFWAKLPGPNAGGVLEEQSSLSAGDSEIQLFFGKENSYLFSIQMANGH